MISSNLDKITDYPIPTQDYFIQAQEAEQLTSVHRVTLLRWAKRGIAPQPQKIAGIWLWRHSEIQQLIAGEWSAK